MLTILCARSGRVSVILDFSAPDLAKLAIEAHGDLER
jgi:hypothetical protein